MRLLLPAVHILVSVLLIFAILIQTEGQGLSATFGGGEIYHTRRGAEKFIFYTTIILAIFFVITSLLNVIVS